MNGAVGRVDSAAEARKPADEYPYSMYILETPRQSC